MAIITNMYALKNLIYSTYFSMDVDGIVLFYSFKNNFIFSKTYTLSLNDYNITIASNILNICIPIINDEVKYYFPNYKDYYYLPFRR